MPADYEEERLICQPVVKFDLGQITISEASSLVAPEELRELLEWHAAGNWGEVSPTQWRLNDQSIPARLVIVSQYETAAGQVRVVTDLMASPPTTLVELIGVRERAYD